jgi:hypothetical protein
MPKQETLSIIELQNLREDVERLLRGEKTLKELVFEVKNMFLPNRYLPNFIFEKAGISIGIGSHYSHALVYKLKFKQDPPGGMIAYDFGQPEAIIAVALINQLLDDRTMRKHVIDHLVNVWAPRYREWFAVFTNGLEGRALMHLLLEPRLKETSKPSTLQLRKDILALVGNEKIAEVIQAAERVRKLVSLYELTRWPGCQGRGGHVDRKKVLSVDLNL